MTVPDLIARLRTWGAPTKQRAKPLMKEAADLIEALEAELAAERARVEAKDARIAELERALEPFAKAGELFPEAPFKFDRCIYRPSAGDEYALTGEHLRTARATLRREQP